MPNSNDFNHFTSNPTDIHIDRSLFNMDHSVKYSCNVGECIPFEVIECLPGDTWNIETSKVIRLQPLVAPIFDEVIQDVYYFFCPTRLVWEHWKQFCGENTSSPWAPNTTYQVPSMYPPSGGWNVGTIADYMGIPPKVDGVNVNALPFRAYALICDQWFRSESVMNPVNVQVGDYVWQVIEGVNTKDYGSNGDDQVIDIELGGKPFIACKFFDYFTSALPAPQRGDAVNVFPDSTYAPVVSLTRKYQESKNIKHPFFAGKNAYDVGFANSTVHKFSNTDISFKNGSTFSTYSGANNIYGDPVGIRTDTTSGFTPNASTNPLVFSNLFTELNATTFNINDLRQAFAVQRFLEKSARFGGRYITFIKGFFGIDSPDARLQRTEYIGGSRLSLNINSVEQTSATQENSTPLGNVAGMSVTADVNEDCTFSCTEHGYIIGISVLRYHHSYQQSCNKMWLRRSFTDFYLPTFAFLGEQEVYTNELYYRDRQYDEKEVFGYQERWSEYRYMPNRIAGMFRSVSNTSLDVWHLGDYYNSKPTLSPEWLREDKTMLDRCLAVTSDVADQCLCDFYIKAKAARPLPMYSVPGLIDHY